MQVGKYLSNNQSIVYQTFVNSLKNHTLSHAYLLVGAPGIPLFDIAKYLAKSILCDDPSPLACENCITCLRIGSDNYPDVITLDGSTGTIKKEMVLNVENKFEKTAFERKGIMIYIINLVENMTVEAVNSMLKFLEEPEAEVYAFLTTHNENNVLPTILSRCQILHLKSLSKKQVIQDALEFGVSQDDAELLSYFYNDGEMIFDILNDKDQNDYYQNSKKAFVELLEILKDGNRRDAIYHAEKEIAPLVKTKESMRFFLDMMTAAFEDLVNINCNREITLSSYATILTALAEKLPHLSESLLEILKQRNIVNANIGLQLDHLIIYITKEKL